MKLTIQIPQTIHMTIIGGIISIQIQIQQFKIHRFQMELYLQHQLLYTKEILQT